jgi:hypothetical protein
MVDVIPPTEELESGEEKKMGGRKVRGATAKNLKKMLKAAGLKTTGRKAALTRRAKKAHLKIRGGASGPVVEGPATMAGGSTLSPHPVGGRRRSRKGGMDAGRKRSRRSRKFLGVF